jgi:glucan biosynthesis protein C
MTSTTNTGSRLYFLDWVRIAAFLVLICYHVGMYYVTWGWHVKSPDASRAIEPLMMLSSPWRLGLLFMISGVASSFMLAKISATRFMRQRSVRLLVPLLFGMLVIVPPQPYFEVIEKLAYDGSYLDFMKLYLGAYHGFCKDSSCLTLPTWNHLWFVAYLWIYTLLLGALVLALGPRFETLAQRVASLLTGWKIVVLPVAVLAAIRMALVQFPANHAVVGDWYNHAMYLFLFVLGALLARQRGVWERIDAVRWPALGIALACWAGLVILDALPDGLIPAAQLAYWRPAFRTLYATLQWTPILAVCGFAHRHFQFDSAKRRYLTQAVFPVYIVHQTLIVSMAHGLKVAKLAPAIEGPLLVVLTLTLSFGIFELVRRVRVLQPLFGLAAEPRRVQPVDMERRYA